MLSFLSILNLIIAVQAIFLGFHFFIKKKSERRLNVLIALLCLIFSVITFNTYLNLNGYFNLLFQDIANNCMWFIGPSLYLFTIYHENEGHRKLTLIHTLPYLVLALIGVTLKGRWIDILIPLLGFSQMCLYMLFTIAHSRKNYNKARSFYNWILPTVITFSFLITVNVILNILKKIDITLLPNNVLQSFTSVLAIPIFYIAYKEMNSSGDFGLLQKKYKSSHLSEAKSTEYLQKVEDAIHKDKLYLNPNLTLSILSQHIGVKPKYISQVINQELNLSFTQYLLKLRIDKVKQDLVSPDKKHLTISGIAQEAGFASGSRFNHLFKETVGVTPSQYQKDHLYK